MGESPEAKAPRLPLHTSTLPHLQDVLRRVNESPEAKSPQGRRLLEAALDVMTLLHK